MNDEISYLLSSASCSPLVYLTQNQITWRDPAEHERFMADLIYQVTIRWIQSLLAAYNSSYNLPTCLSGVHYHTAFCGERRVFLNLNILLFVPIPKFGNLLTYLPAFGIWLLIPVVFLGS